MAEPRVRCSVVADQRGATVPVTLKLSKKFYDRFGDDIANEFVNWFNAVDTTYRSDLIQLNDTNFVRFDAKLEQRFAEQDAKRERRFADADVKLEKRFSEADVKLEKRLGDFCRTIVNWIVGLWLTSMLAVGGMFFALLRLR